MTAATLVEAAMGVLAAKRPIFHSEADFQHALAWEIQLAHPDAQIRLEKRVAVSPRIDVDVLVALAGSTFGIELKYPRKGMTAEVGGELFTLATGADDHGRYFAVEDVARLERLAAAETIDSGAMVLLTNVANVWAPPTGRRRVLYDAFRMHDTHTLAGTMAWGDWGRPGGRPPGATGTITLAGTYPLGWHDYSTVNGVQFRYLLVAVDEVRTGLSGSRM